MKAAASETVWQQHRGEFTVSTDPARLDVEVVYDYLARSYWAQGIPRETVHRALQNSLCFGLYQADAQIGLARVVTDRITYAYVCDVFVLESQQGKGLGTWLMQCVVGHPELRDLRRWQLVTRDAHTVYERVGFRVVAKPERHMELTNPAVLNF